MTLARRFEAAESSPTVVRPGHNCWRREHADRVSLLIDGADYYAAVHEALSRARHSVYILGWNIDSRVELIPGQPSAAPRRLGPLLEHLVERNPDLTVRILCWDFAPIYVFERQPSLQFRFGRKQHPRIRFHRDDTDPPGASHHQKIVVIDDAVAFSGGLDLCEVRWDTRAHRADEARRIDSAGRAYRPHHDAQIVVDGHAAAALGELARHRWRLATGETLHRTRVTGDPWPATTRPTFVDIEVGIARTSPAHPPHQEVRENEALWLDMLRSARRTIYLETPYFTSRTIGEALALRLREPSGPEVILVTSQTPNGWLEESTLGVLRNRLVASLREADHAGRFWVWCPHAADDPSLEVNVHAKLCIVDDQILRVGSGNMTNRSLGLDTECDLVVEAAGREDVRATIGRVRDGLLAEHLRVDPGIVRDAAARYGSVGRGVRALANAGPIVRPCERIGRDLADRMLVDADLVDPDHPLNKREIANRLMGSESGRKWRWVAAAWWVTLVGAVVVANLAGWFSAVDLLQWIATVADAGPWSVIVVALAFTAGGLLLIPVTLLIANAGLVFGPWWGSVYALIGAFVSAAVYFWMGRRLGRELVELLGGPRVRDAARAVAERGLLAVAAVRLVPVAPHAVVGLVAGAARIGFRDYMLGTIVGMGPGSVVLVMLGHGLAIGLRGASPQAWLPAAGIVVIGLLVAWLLQRWLGQGAQLSDEQDDDAT